MNDINLFVVKGIVVTDDEIAENDLDIDRLKLDYFWIEEEKHYVVGETLYKGNINYPEDMPYEESDLEPGQHLTEQLKRLNLDKIIKLYTFLIHEY